MPDANPNTVTNEAMMGCLVSALRAASFEPIVAPSRGDRCVGACAPRAGFFVLMLCEGGRARLQVFSATVALHELTFEASALVENLLRFIAEHVLSGAVPAEG